MDESSAAIVAEKVVSGGTMVNNQVTDAVTQTNVTVLGESPSQSMGLVYQSMAQSISLLMQNGVSTQGGMQQINAAVIATACREIMAGSKPEPPAPLGNVTVKYSGPKSISKVEENTEPSTKQVEENTEPSTKQVAVSPGGSKKSDPKSPQGSEELSEDEGHKIALQQGTVEPGQATS